MTPEQKEFLSQAESDLFDKVQNLRNHSNDSLENGANYAFVLCNAKINFINSIITDVRWALSGNAPDVVVESIILAVQHVDENFKAFLGACDACNYKHVQISPEKSHEISRRMAESMKNNIGNDEPFTEA